MGCSTQSILDQANLVSQLYSCYNMGKHAGVLTQETRDTVHMALETAHGPEAFEHDDGHGRRAARGRAVRISAEKLALDINRPRCRWKS